MKSPQRLNQILAQFGIVEPDAKSGRRAFGIKVLTSETFRNPCKRQCGDTEKRIPPCKSPVNGSKRSRPRCWRRPRWPGQPLFCAVLQPTGPRFLWARALHAALQLYAAFFACSKDVPDAGVTVVCCLQSLFLPGSTGVQREFSANIRPSDSHPWTAVSLILYEACKYPHMCAMLPSWGTLYVEHTFCDLLIALFSCASLKIARNAR